MTNKFSKMPLSFCLAVTGVSLLWVAATASADDWLQWRGDNFTSVSNETNLPVKFDKNNNMAWRLEMPGTAGSSPVVAGSNVFVTSVDGSEMYLICISTEGKLRWKRKFEGSNLNSRDGANSASASPSTDGKHVWAMMGNGALACYTVDGEKVWTKDLQEVYGAFSIQFGMSSTPILYKGNLYLALIDGKMFDRKNSSVGKVICLEAATGKEKWFQLRKTDGISENKHSYASPTIYVDGDTEMLITHGADYTIGHSIKDGKELWRCGGLNPKGDSYNPFLRLVASPVCGDGMIIVPTAKRGPVFGISPKDSTSFDVRWKMERGTPDVATPVIYKGKVYLAGERGDLTCLDVENGNKLKTERIFADKHRSTPVAADGKLYIADRKGAVFVVAAGPELKVLAKNELNEETTASPAISNGRIYIRTFDALYCFGNNS